ncbi:trimeric intracellular cation channel family protein [bacterium]|nr:trimeric intracellular cation channel family protein [bacterium]
MFQLIELFAVLAGATYGVLLARRHRMDFVGVFSVAFIIAFAGGTLRDLFLDRHPLFWIKHDEYAVIVFVLALVTSILPQIPSAVERWLFVPDALGMSLFSVVGAGFAIEAGTSMFIASLLGVVAGTFGGVIGDIVCNQIPSLFRPATPLYATCSFSGCWVFLLLRKFGVEELIAVIAGLSVSVVFRFAAIHWNLCLPAAREEAQNDE